MKIILPRREYRNLILNIWKGLDSTWNLNIWSAQSFNAWLEASVASCIMKVELWRQVPLLPSIASIKWAIVVSDYFSLVSQPSLWADTVGTRPITLKCPCNSQDSRQTFLQPDQSMASTNLLFIVLSNFKLKIADTEQTSHKLLLHKKGWTINFFL